MDVTSSLCTDLYQLTMMAGYEAAGLTTSSTFELFVRELPERRSYLMAAGLDLALEYLEGLEFTPDEIAWLRTTPALASVSPRFFDDVLPAFRFRGDVWAVEEGEIVFGHEPLVRVTAPTPQAQLVETALLSLLTFQTSVASKAARVVTAAAGRPVVEFGSRRAHGPQAARLAARSACLAGCQATSNVDAARRYGLALAGTMAHSWVMAFSDEVEAFRQSIALFGNQTTLLIDTYDTVRAASAIVQAGLKPSAVRLDSGDLGSLARAVRAVFDAGGLTSTRILVSGDLDEYKVAALVAARAPVDAFGVGTAISAVSDAPALGGVYKLVETVRQGLAAPTVKLSAGKRTYPGRKQVWRTVQGGTATGDIIGIADEAGGEGRPLLRQVMRKGRRLAPVEPMANMSARAAERLRQMPASVRAIEGSTPYPVRISPALDQLARTAMRAHAG